MQADRFGKTERNKSSKEKKILKDKVNNLNKTIINEQALYFRKEKILQKEADSLNSFVVKLSNENNILKLNIDSIKQDLKIKNVNTIVGDVKNLKSKFDFVLGRAVTKMEKFVPLVKKNILIQKDESGIIYLKGGELNYEEKKFPNIKIHSLKNMFESNFFETKKIIYIPQKDI